MNLYRDTGVVLRVQKLGEADRIVTLLTRRHGRVRAVAKGVRRTTSRFGARLEPFSHVDVQFYSGPHRSTSSPRPRRSTRSAPRLVGDYGRYTAGMRGAGDRRAARRREGEPALRLYLLVVGALRALAEPGSGTRRWCSTPSCSARWHRGLGAGPHRLRPMRRPGTAPGVQRSRRRRGLPVPSGRRGHPVGPDRALLDALESAGLADRRDAAPPVAARPPAWSPRTCSGTWNAGSARCRWSNAPASRIQRVLIGGRIAPRAR